MKYYSKTVVEKRLQNKRLVEEFIKTKGRLLFDYEIVKLKNSRTIVVSGTDKNGMYYENIYKYDKVNEQWYFVEYIEYE